MLKGLQTCAVSRTWREWEHVRMMGGSVRQAGHLTTIRAQSPGFARIGDRPRVFFVIVLGFLRERVCVTVLPVKFLALFNESLI